MTTPPNIKEIDQTLNNLLNSFLEPTHIILNEDRYIHMMRQMAPRIRQARVFMAAYRVGRQHGLRYPILFAQDARSRFGQVPSYPTLLRYLKKWAKWMARHDYDSQQKP